MRVVLEQHPVEREISIYILEEGANEAFAMQVHEDGRLHQFKRLKNGEIAPPALRISARALEAIVREAAQIVPVGDAGAEALRDTRQVRDRLLTIVERMAQES